MTAEIGKPELIALNKNLYNQTPFAIATLSLLEIHQKKIQIAKPTLDPEEVIRRFTSQIAENNRYWLRQQKLERYHTPSLEAANIENNLFAQLEVLRNGWYHGRLKNYLIHLYEARYALSLASNIIEHLNSSPMWMSYISEMINNNGYLISGRTRYANTEGIKRRINYDDWYAQKTTKSLNIVTDLL
jgi:hypothetical protein